MTSDIIGNYCKVYVCEIDIVNWTQWCCRYTPHEIFEVMTKYNDTICEWIKDFDHVNKLELVGDSMLILSTDVTSLVCLCNRIICNVNTIKKDVFKDDRIDLRMGLHVGDVYGNYINNPQKYQIFGKVVNIASRLEQLAIPGTIHMSEEMYDLIKHESLMNRFSIGKTKLQNLKGIGDFNSITLFTKRENCLIADDNLTQVMVLGHIINKQHNSTCIQITCVEECFDILKKKYFDEVVILDRFFETVDALPLLQEFRKWECENRQEVQQVILISANKASKQILKDEHFILKDTSFYLNFKDLYDSITKTN